MAIPIPEKAILLSHPIKDSTYFIMGIMKGWFFWSAPTDLPATTPGRCGDT